MNPKVQELLSTVKQLVTEIEGGESEMPEDGMEEGAEGEEMPEEGGAEVEIEMKPKQMQKRMGGGGGMPESLRKFTGGR